MKSILLTWTDGEFIDLPNGWKNIPDKLNITLTGVKDWTEGKRIIDMAQRVFVQEQALPEVYIDFEEDAKE